MDTAQYVKDILKRPTDRDKQRQVGASQISSACTRCLAEDMAGIPKEQGPYNMGAIVGTAVHEYLEHRNLDETAQKEMRVELGTIEGYGTVKSTTDLYLPRERLIVDLKGLALDTPLPTPTGWTTMGDVQEGDYLLDESGKPTKVVGKSGVKHLKRYEVLFSDATTVTCDHTHLWNVVVGQNAAQYKHVTWSTDQIFQARQEGQVIRVMNSASLDLPEVDLPIDPYVLGVWLGDGEVGKAMIDLHRDKKAGVVTELRARGETVTERKYPSDSGRSTQGVRYSLVPPEKWGKTNQLNEFSKRLRAAGVLDNKHIPKQYLRASYQQRLDLIRGLMDTDGSYHPKRKMATYSTTDESFAYSLSELINTMGWKAHVMPGKAKWTYKGEVKQTNQYMLSFKPDVNPFLGRNQHVDFAAQITKESTWRYVRSLKELSEGPTQCVMVDSDTRTYLCSHQFIPTHNTTTRDKLARYQHVVEGGDLLTDAQETAKATLEQYFRQTQLYAMGVANAGYPVEQVGIVFVCRDGQVVDRDIWATPTQPYNPEAAAHYFERARKIWTYVDAGLPLDKLKSADHCYYCNQVRPYIIEEVEL